MPAAAGPPVGRRSRNGRDAHYGSIPILEADDVAGAMLVITSQPAYAVVVSWCGKRPARPAFGAKPPQTFG